MKTIENILTRRTIREYLDKSISTTDMKKILSCAMAGPTGLNCQEWEFIVINDKAVLKQLTENVGQSMKMVPNSATTIIICANTQKASPIAKDLWVVDMPIAAQNICLSANELGIGSVMLGVYPNEPRMNAIKAMFNLPSHIVPYIAIALGYPNETKPPRQNYNENLVHINKW